MKIKPILPSLREKKRYLVFEIISKNKITDFAMVSNAIVNNTLSFLGELGTAKAGINMLRDKFDTASSRGIIRVNNSYVDSLRSALSLISNFNGEQAIVRSVGVSGILKKACNKYLS